MQTAFMAELTLFGKAANLESDDIYYYLNRSQQEYVERSFNGLNDLRSGFEQHPQVTDDLRTLVVEDAVINTTYEGNPYRSFYVDKGAFPAGYLYHLSARADIATANAPNPAEGQPRTGVGSTKIIASKVQQADIFRVLDDPFRKPCTMEVIYTVSEEGISVYSASDFVVPKIHLNYIKVPTTIGQAGGEDSDLPDFVHDVIVKDAVQLFLAADREVRSLNQQEKEPITELTE
jgi:hypothetical protein